MPLREILFLLATLALVYVSRTALLHPRSHGFYRFLAWECILAQLALNAVYWFVRPLAWNQLISWVLLCASLYLVVAGARLLHMQGRQNAQRGGEALLGFEQTTSLVTTGIYAYIRHPMYSSLLCLAWAVFFKAPGWLAAALAGASSAFLLLTAVAEEAENRAYFGEVYDQYCRITHRFIPFIF